VENFGKRPKTAWNYCGRIRFERTPTVTQSAPIDTPRSRSLTLRVRFIPKGSHGKGRSHFSTEYASSQAHARISGADGQQERPSRTETPSSQGPQTLDGEQRIARTSQRSTESSRLRFEVDVRFRPEERIRRRAEFKQVYERGVRIHSRYSTVFILSNERGAGRLGIAATRKLGGAVQRNRAKRLIREVFRRNKIAAGFDVVVIPKRDLLDASLSTLETDYRTLLERRLRPVR
jgi:ribonuclease P protein component